MEEIKVNINELNNSINRLQELNWKINKFNVEPVVPQKRGGGNTVNQLAELGLVYKEIGQIYSDLVKNTIMYLSNVRDSYVNADSKVASKIKQ